MRAVLASMLLIFSAPALAGPEASGRIGLSLEIPPRISLETRQTGSAVTCINEEAGPGRLRVVDPEGRALPACDARRTRHSGQPVRRVMVIPV